MSPFEMPTHCAACNARLTPLDMRHFELCNACAKAAKEFARDLPVEHERESEEAADVT